MRPARMLPRPWLSLALLLMWLLLNQSLAAGHWLLGAVLGTVLPLLLQRLAPMPVRRVSKPLKLLRLTDADALVREVKNRYESQLLEILPC